MPSKSVQNQKIAQVQEIDIIKKLLEIDGIEHFWSCFAKFYVIRNHLNDSEKVLYYPISTKHNGKESITYIFDWSDPDTNIIYTGKYGTTIAFIELMINLYMTSGFIVIWSRKKDTE